MLSSLNLKHLTLDNSSDIANLHKKCFPHFWTKSEFDDLLQKETTFAFGTFHNKQLLSLVLWQASLDEADILTLCTHPDYRNKSLSSALLTHSTTWLRQNNNTRHFFLEVDVHNHAAIGLYEKTGFLKTGLRRNYYNHGGFFSDAVIMNLEK